MRGRRIPIGDRIPDCTGFEASSKVLLDVMVKCGAIEKSPKADELIRPGFCGK